MVRHVPGGLQNEGKMTEKKDRKERQEKRRKKLVQSRLETEGVAEQTMQENQSWGSSIPPVRFLIYLFLYSDVLVGKREAFTEQSGNARRNPRPSERDVLPAATEWNDRCFRGHQSMKHEEFLRLWKRVTYYQETPAVIQRPCALGRKCPREKSAFANDEGNCVEDS